MMEEEAWEEAAVVDVKVRVAEETVAVASAVMAMELATTVLVATMVGAVVMGAECLGVAARLGEAMVAELDTRHSHYMSETCTVAPPARGGSSTRTGTKGRMVETEVDSEMDSQAAHWKSR